MSLPLRSLGLAGFVAERRSGFSFCILTYHTMNLHFSNVESSPNMDKPEGTGDDPALGNVQKTDHCSDTAGPFRSLRPRRSWWTSDPISVSRTRSFQLLGLSVFGVRPCLVKGNQKGRRGHFVGLQKRHALVSSRRKPSCKTRLRPC